jgi:lauroyl/myristoyl acyltransferase
LLQRASDAELDARFDVTGFQHVAGRLARGQGLLILGCHLGAHLAAVHWMVRRGLPIRLLVQRPRHIAPTLDRWFDLHEPGDPYPQSAFFLRRGLPPAEAAARVLRARDALRAGRAVYLNGDIPWPTPAGRPGRLLGVERTFLALWADLAVLAEIPVVPLFASHRPGGRYALTFDPPLTIASGGQASAVATYLARLDAVIAADPAEAIPHLTWPAYAAAAPPSPRSARPRPSNTTPMSSITRCPPCRSLPSARAAEPVRSAGTSPEGGATIAIRRCETDRRPGDHTRASR